MNKKRINEIEFEFFSTIPSKAAKFCLLRVEISTELILDPIFIVDFSRQNADALKLLNYLESS